MDQRFPAFILLPLALASVSVSCRRRAPEKPLIGVAVQGARVSYTAACLAAIEKSAEGRAELAVMDGAGDKGEQLSQIERLIGMKARSLIASPASAADAAGIIAVAKAKNVPLVLIGEQPAIEALRSWDKVLYVGHSPSQAGAAQGRILAAAWKARPLADADGDGVMRLAFVGPRAGAAAVEERRQGCMDALAAAGVKVAALEARGAAALAALSARSGARVEAVAAEGAESAILAVAALEAAGRMRGKAPVPVVSLEPGRAAPSRVELEGSRLAGTVAGDPAAVGDAALDAAYALAFHRDPADAGFDLTDGKSVLVPYAAALAADLEAAAK